MARPVARRSALREWLRRGTCSVPLALAACAAPPAEITAPAPPPVPAVTLTSQPPAAAMPGPVDRTPVGLCERGRVIPAADGRVLNHYRYGESPASALVPAPFGNGEGCRVHPAMIPDLMRLIAAANADPAIAGKLRPVSCHRSTALQSQTFCAGIASGRTDGFRDRAWASAPPGFSEHSTGYVIDFGTSDGGGCPDADACFAATPVGKWLIANAARYGFEMSFPAGNKQQVKWEPWHWRWVSTNAAAPGAVAARATFARARVAFPANPGQK